MDANWRPMNLLAFAASQEQKQAAPANKENVRTPMKHLTVKRHSAERSSLLTMSVLG
jgi:hypothetical protein